MKKQSININNLSDMDMLDYINQIDSDEISESKNEKTSDNLCKICNSGNIRRDLSAGYHVCIDCGMVVNDVCEDNFKDIIYDTDKEGTSRFCNPTDFFLPNSSLGTSIKMSKYSRLNIVNRWGNMSYKERSLYNALTEIENICKKHNIQKSIIDNAKIVFKKIRESKAKNGKNLILRKKNRIRIIAACVYYGAKMQNDDRDVKEISEIFNISTSQVNKGCGSFYNILYGNKNNNIVLKNIQVSTASRFINRYSKKLKLNKETILKAKIITENIEKLSIASNHKPLSLSGACILLACTLDNIEINKKDISELLDVSELTIMNIYNKIYKFRNIVIDDEITNRVLEKIKNKSVSIVN